MRSAFLEQNLIVLLDIPRRLSAERCLAPAPGLLFFRFPTLFRTIIFIILTGSLMLAQAPSPSLDSLLSQAIELEKDRDYAGAEKITAKLCLPYRMIRRSSKGWVWSARSSLNMRSLSSSFAKF